MRFLREEEGGIPYGFRLRSFAATPPCEAPGPWESQNMRRSIGFRVTSSSGAWLLVGALLALASSPLSRADGPRDDGEPERNEDGDRPTVAYFLGEVTVAPGEIAEVPFSIESDVPLSLVAWSIEYQAGPLEFVEAVPSDEVLALTAERPAEESSFEVFRDEDDENDKARYEIPALSGASLSPPVETTATGRARIEIETDEHREDGDDGSEGDEAMRIEVRVDLERIEGVTSIELAVDPMSENTAVLRTLAEFAPPGLEVLEKETVLELALDPASLAVLPERGYDGSVASLRSLLDERRVGIIVRTTSSPNGEIGGAFRSARELERWFQVSLVTDFAGRDEFSIPAGERIEIAALRFRVASDAAPGRYELDFSRAEDAGFDGRFRDGEDIVFNVVKPRGGAINTQDPFGGSTAASGVPGAIVLSIIGDIGILRSGDVNRDRRIDLSDPVKILGHLFLGADAPPCRATADVNEDQKIDISDPIAILDYLFVGAGEFLPRPIDLQSVTGSDPGCY